METKWLVCIASLAAVGTATLAANAAPSGAGKPGDAAPSQADESEGPFAPHGKTGRLRENVPVAVVADEEQAAPAPEDKPGRAGVDVVYGWGTAGAGEEAFDVSVASFVIGAAYQVSPAMGLRIRIPFATGKITEAGGSYYQAGTEPYNAAVFGNLEVAGSYTMKLGEHSTLPIELAVTPPTAGGDYFSSDQAAGRRYRVNAAAQVTRGLEDDALFAPHRLGIVPGGRFRFRTGAMDVGAFLKVPILIRAGGEDPQVLTPLPNTPEYQLNSTVIEVVAGGSFFYGILANKVDLGVRAWAAALSSEFFDATLPNATGPSKFQLVLEPQARAQFGALRPSLGFIWPVGGRLGGSANGLRIDLAAVF